MGARHGRGRQRGRRREVPHRVPGEHHRAPAVGSRGDEGGWDCYVTTLTNPQTFATIQLTVLTSLLVTAVNVVVGTVIAWVLVRDHFWDKRVLDFVIDIPFALPTIVAGLVLLSLYGHQRPLGVVSLLRPKEDSA